MFKWKRRTMSPDSQAVLTPVPAPVMESTPSPVLEKDNPIQYNLISAQLRILPRNGALTIIDAGAHHGHTTEQYLENFAQARVIGIEPDRENFAKATVRVARFGSRVELVCAGLSETVGTAELYRNTYDMTHSLLKLGDMRYYDEPFAVLGPEKAALAPAKIDTLTIDSLCAARNIEVIDILKMDIQGGELMALRGAKDMLSRGAIRLIVLEVNFVPMYRDMPTFWDIADHLCGHGYALQGIYELRHQPQQPAVLCWADAIFVAPQMQTVSETVKPPSSLDEALDTVGGQPLPAEFIENARLSEDASIREGQPPVVAQISTPIDRLDGWQSASSAVSDVIIDTSSISYRYAIVATPNPQMVRNLKAGGLVTVEISVEVMTGKLGVVWADAEYYPIEATERYISAMSGMQRVLISVPSERAHHLVLRNATPDSTRTSFKLAGIRGKVSR
jgi:FkbM family methyltransferase